MILTGSVRPDLQRRMVPLKRTQTGTFSCSVFIPDPDLSCVQMGFHQNHSIQREPCWETLDLLNRTDPKRLVLELPAGVMWTNWLIQFIIL